MKTKKHKLKSVEGYENMGQKGVNLFGLTKVKILNKHLGNLFWSSFHTC